MSKKCRPLWREEHHTLGPLFDVQISLCVAGAQNCEVVKSEQKKTGGLVAVPKTRAGVGHLKRIWKDGFRVEVRELMS